MYMGLNNSLNWLQLLRINPSWISDLLLKHPEYTDNIHINVRAFTVSFDDKKENLDGLAEFMVQRIKEYVLTPSEIKELEKRDIDPWREAASYFGNRKSESEGKYGELLLFLLIEGILKSPMVAHKIKSISNMNAQVNGADGIFLGEINGAPSLLLGESKMIGGRSRAISEALESISVFHEPLTKGTAMKTELGVAKRNIIELIDDKQLDYLMKALDYQSDTYKSLHKIYPVLIVYDDTKIKKIKCKGKVDGEKQSEIIFKSSSKSLLKIIQHKISEERKILDDATLDFFFLPVSSVKTFRNLIHNKIHLQG